MTTPPTVSVHAAILVASRTQFKLTVQDSFDRGESVVVDLTDCPYIDSSGLGVLVSLARQAEKLGLAFTIHNPNEEVRSLFQQSRLDTVLRVTPETRDDAPAVAA